jgi:hypothetical protein
VLFALFYRRGQRLKATKARGGSVNMNGMAAAARHMAETTNDDHHVRHVVLLQCFLFSYPLIHISHHPLFCYRTTTSWIQMTMRVLRNPPPSSLVCPWQDLYVAGAGNFDVSYCLYVSHVKLSSSSSLPASFVRMEP